MFIYFVTIAIDSNAGTFASFSLFFLSSSPPLLYYPAPFLIPNQLPFSNPLTPNRYCLYNISTLPPYFTLSCVPLVTPSLTHSSHSPITPGAGVTMNHLVFVTRPPPSVCCLHGKSFERRAMVGAPLPDSGSEQLLG